MLYQSERNYGCRFLEIAILGYRALILLDKGTEIIELNHKETDTDFLWRSPLGLSCLRKIRFAPVDEQALTDGYTGGWFEAFPNVGEACRHRGALLPHYGEVCYLPWEYTVLKDDPGEVALKCFVRTTKTPFFVEKTFSLKTGVAALRIEESARNLGGESLHYQWGHHPNFGPPFLTGKCLLDLPGGEIFVDYAAPGSRLTQGTRGLWPYIPGRDCTEIDLRTIPPAGAGGCEEISVNNLPEGWVRIADPERGIGLRLDWDVIRCPHLLLWQVTNGDTGYPRYGGTHVLGCIPRTDTVRGLADAAQAGGCRMIGPNETITLWITATVTFQS